MADARRGARAPRAGLAGDDSGVVKNQSPPLFETNPLLVIVNHQATSIGSAIIHNLPIP